MKQLLKLLLVPLLSACAAILLFTAVTAAAAGPSTPTAPTAPSTPSTLTAPSTPTTPSTPTVQGPVTPAAATIPAVSGLTATSPLASAPTPASPANNPPDTSVNTSCMGATGQCQKGKAWQSNSTGSGNTNTGNVNVNNSCAGSTGTCKAGDAHQTNNAGSSGGSGGGATVNPTGNTTTGNFNINNSCAGSSGDCQGGNADQSNRAGNVGQQSLASADPPSQTQTASPTGNDASANHNTNNSCMTSSGTCWSGNASQTNEAGNVGSQQLSGGSAPTSQTASPMANQATNSLNTNNSCSSSSSDCHGGNANQTNAAGNVGSQSIGGQGQGDPTQTASPSSNFANDQFNTNNGCMGSSVKCWSGDATQNSYAGNVGSQSINGDSSGTTSQTASPTGNSLAQNSNTNNGCAGQSAGWYGDTCSSGGASQTNATGNVGSQDVNGGHGQDPTQTASPTGNSIGRDNNTNNACMTTAGSCQGGSAKQSNASGNVGSQSISGDQASTTQQTASPMGNSANQSDNINNACNGAGSSYRMTPGQGCDAGSANQSNASGNVGSQQVGGSRAADPTQVASPQGNGSDFNQNTNNACAHTNGYCDGGSANQGNAAGNVGSQSIGSGYGGAAQIASPSQNAANSSTNTNNACQGYSGSCDGGSANQNTAAGNVGSQSINGGDAGSTQTASPSQNAAVNNDNTNNACSSSTYTANGNSCEGGSAVQGNAVGNVGSQTISIHGADPQQTANPQGNSVYGNQNNNNACASTGGPVGNCEAGSAAQHNAAGNVGSQDISGYTASNSSQTANPSANSANSNSNANNACAGSGQKLGTGQSCEAGSASQGNASGNVGSQRISNVNADPTQVASPQGNGSDMNNNQNNPCASSSGYCEGGSALQGNAAGNVGGQDATGGSGTQTASPSSNAANSNSNVNNGCSNSAGSCEATGSARQSNAAGNVGQQELSGAWRYAGGSQTASPQSNVSLGNINFNQPCYASTGSCEANGSSTQRNWAGNVQEQQLGGRWSYASATQDASPQSNSSSRNAAFNQPCFGSQGQCEANGSVGQTNAAGNVGEQQLGGNWKYAGVTQTASPNSNSADSNSAVNQPCYGSQAQCEANGSVWQTNGAGNVGEQELNGSGYSLGVFQTASPQSNQANNNSAFNQPCFQTTAECEANGSVGQRNLAGNVGEQQLGGNWQFAGVSQTASPQSNEANGNSALNQPCYQSSAECEARGGVQQNNAAGNVGEQELTTGGKYVGVTQTASPQSNQTDGNSDVNQPCFQSSAECEVDAAIKHTSSAGNVGEQDTAGSASPSGFAASGTTVTNSPCFQSSTECEQKSVLRLATANGDSNGGFNKDQESLRGHDEESRKRDEENRKRDEENRTRDEENRKRDEDNRKRDEPSANRDDKDRKNDEEICKNEDSRRDDQEDREEGKTGRF